MALTDNLISYWKMDEASGNALDAHGSNNLTDQNTVGSTTGKINNARDFESGNAEYFDIASNSTVNVGTGAFSFSVWVKLESSAPFAGNQIINKDLYGLYYFNPSGGISARIDGAPYESTDLTIDDTNWHHVVMVRNGSNVKIYQDGTSVLDTTASAANLDNTFPFTIGSYTEGGQFWDGLIDEVGFWKRALSGAEVTELYNGGAGLAYPFTAATVHTPKPFSLQPILGQ